MNGYLSFGATIAVLTLCSGAVVQQAQSTFDSGLEGWTGAAIWSIDTRGAVNYDVFQVTWYPPDGDPGGCIGFPELPTTRDVFVAPPAFLGTNGSSLGSDLSFDLTTTRGSETRGPQPLVTLVGAGRSLTYRAEIVPAWTHYTVALHPEGWEEFIWGWGNYGPSATQDDLVAVLSNLSAMYIWGDFTPEIDESTRLDNVTMTFNTNTAVLNTSVVGGHGNLAPASGDYTLGAKILLTATPDSGYQVQSWTGTDDDTSTALTNYVTIDGDKSVTVSFELAPTPPPDDGSSGTGSKDSGSSDTGSSGTGSSGTETAGTGSSDSPQGAPGSGSGPTDTLGDTAAPPAAQCGGCGTGAATLTAVGMLGMGLVTRLRVRRRPA